MCEVVLFAVCISVLFHTQYNFIAYTIDRSLFEDCLYDRGDTSYSLLTFLTSILKGFIYVYCLVLACIYTISCTTIIKL